MLVAPLDYLQSLVVVVVLIIRFSCLTLWNDMHGHLCVKSRVCLSLCKYRQESWRQESRSLGSPFSNQTVSVSLLIRSTAATPQTVPRGLNLLSNTCAARCLAFMCRWGNNNKP